MEKEKKVSKLRFTEVQRFVAEFLRYGDRKRIIDEVGGSRELLRRALKKEHLSDLTDQEREMLVKAISVARRNQVRTQRLIAKINKKAEGVIA